MRKIELILVAVILLMLLFGLLIVYDASSYSAFKDFNDQYHYIKEQFRWAVLGVGALIFFSLFDYHKFYYLSLPILLVALIMLVLVLIPGVGIHVLGARRWINAGFFVIQPAEFVKLAVAIYLASWFSKKEKKRFLPFCILLGAILGLIMLQPDMGTASIIMAEGLMIYFLSGAPLSHFFMIFPVLCLAGLGLIMVAPYRAARLTAFLNFGGSLDKTSYHVKQILIALGSGGLTGVGIGNSLQKYAYLPETTTDSIFAIIGEEFGWIGATILIIFYMVFISLCFKIAQNAKDSLGKLLAGGIISFLAVQIVLNLSAQTALVPLTGVPLPFISYGGSALIVDLCAVGILLNISRQAKYTN